MRRLSLAQRRPHRIPGRWARSAIGTITNITIFCSDARALTGQSFGNVSVRRAVATVSPHVDVEDGNPTVQWSQVGTAGYRIALPTSYDCRVPNPVCSRSSVGAGRDTLDWQRQRARCRERFPQRWVCGDRCLAHDEPHHVRCPDEPRRLRHRVHRSCEAVRPWIGGVLRQQYGWN